MRARKSAPAAALFLAPGLLFGQAIHIAGRTVQIHGFVQQGFAYSNQNNFLTMNTSQGSFAMTEGGLNISTQLTDKLRVGVQVFDRYLGNLDKGQVQLDWAVVDYRAKPWFGLRGGRVKTTLGLFNDTQDMEFLHPFALLPQSMYPSDQRSNMIAHIGGDLYGDIPLKRLGTLSYTVYGGRRPNAPHEGFRHSMEALGTYLNSWAGTVKGADLRWTLPIRGLLAGASYMDQSLGGEGACIDVPSGCPGPGGAWEVQVPVKDQTQQFYLQFTKGRLDVNSEYRRRYRIVSVVDSYRDEEIGAIGPYYPEADSRSWYASASYRVNNHLQLGTYYSRYWADWRRDTSRPDNHIYDRVMTARVDLTKHWNLKVEGHFMHGYGPVDSARGFYPQENPGNIPTPTGAPGLVVPTGLVPVTHMLVIRTGYTF